VGSRFFSKLLVVLTLAAGAGCGRFAVRAYEKEHLSDRTMRFDVDAQETSMGEHVLGTREGAVGGKGTGGGGCGCN
jgi:hypothetical protein